MRTIIIAAIVVVLALVLVLISQSMTQPEQPVNNLVEENPTGLVWLNELIRRLENEPVANPPSSIVEYQYNGQTVYFKPAPCCDQFSTLYDENGGIIGHPDGGFDGQGDDRTADFFAVRSDERVVWKDEREPQRE